MLNCYYYVGGMPEAVDEYVRTSALPEVQRLQNDILTGYDRDFRNTSKGVGAANQNGEAADTAAAFQREQRFISGVLRKGARAADFEFAIERLVNAGLVYKVP